MRRIFKVVNKNRGDTIVEVLISVAIAGAVIGGAFALATRSLRQGINASERTEALKIAEGQIEALKFRQLQSDADEWNPNFTERSNINNSCLNVAGNSPAIPSTWRPLKNSSSVSTNDNPDILLTKASGGFYDPVCVLSDKYFINISLTNDLSPPANLRLRPTYLITVRWDAIGGGQNRTQLYYRF